LRNANLRGGPGTSFAVVGKVQVGQTLSIVGANADSSWYQLDSGAWIAAFLVKTVANAPLVGQTPANSQPAQVTDVIDGDTIEVNIAGKTYPLRYILIDTPERGQPFASDATQANQRLVAGKTVYLVKDVNDVDRYNRLLRYVYLGDGTFVNAELVRQGYAVIATFPPDVAKEAEIRTAQQEAVAAGHGLWAKQPGQSLANPSLPTTNDLANLRSGPGTNFAIVGSAQPDQPLTLTGRSADNNWYQLDNGTWINARLVNNAPADLAIVAPVQETAATPTPTPPPAQPAPQAQPQNCDPSYPTVCIPPAPPDLDCPDIPYRRFQVIGADPHRFDGDHDGVGCER
jgi:endonuclease YncB( thermonuclease family)